MNLAEELGITPAQLALAWLLHNGEDIVPVPGTRRKGWLDENAGAAAVCLTPEALERIDALAPPAQAVGATLV